MAPEVLERRYGHAADVWSVGVVAFLMLAGRLPFDGQTDRQIIKAVLDGEPDFGCAAWAGVSGAAADCVRAMLVKDPARRAGIEQLLQHPWLAGRPRSSCCCAPAAAGGGAAAPGCRFCSPSSSSLSSSGAAAAGAAAAAEPREDGSQLALSSSSRTSSVQWASPCAVALDEATTPRQQQLQCSSLRPQLSPLKHCKPRLAPAQP